MSFSRFFKKILQASLFLPAFFIGPFGLALNFQKNLRLNTKDLLIHKKNIDSEKKPAFFVRPRVVLDQNAFERLADSYYLKAELAFFEGSVQKAAAYLKKALLFAPQSRHLKKRLAEIYEREGLLAEALNQWRSLSEEGSEAAPARIFKIYMQSGLYDQALNYHERLSGRPADDFQFHFEKALILIQKKDFAEALASFHSAERRASSLEERASARLSRAFLSARSGKRAKSFELLDGLPFRFINKEDLILKAAQLYKALGHPQKAAFILKAFQEEHGASLSASKMLLDYYISEGLTAPAEKELESLYISGPASAQILFYKSLFLMDKGAYGKALAFLKDLLAEEPRRGQYLYLAGGLCMEKKEWGRAVQFLRRVPESSPYFLAARLQEAQALQRLGRQKASLDLLKKMSKGGGPQALLLYAEALWNEGSKQQALQALTEALKKRSGQTDILFLRGFYYKEAGRPFLALKDMNQILQIQENHKAAHELAEELYFDRRISLHKAERMARKALSLKPDSSYFLNTLGWLLFHKENFQSALHYLKRAFAKNNQDSRAAQRLGRVYLELNDFEKSEFFFKESIRLEERGGPPRLFIPKQASGL